MNGVILCYQRGQGEGTGARGHRMMKLAVLQPPYPPEPTAACARDCIDWMRTRIGQIKPGAVDLVLLPEYANAPGLADRASLQDFAQREGAPFVDFLAAEAKRLNALVAAGVLVRHGHRWLNRVLLYDGAGRQAAYYDKVHLTDVESTTLGVCAGGEASVTEVLGVRIGFAACFDFYFPEHFGALAARGAQLVLCPSYQRSEDSERIRLVCSARALDTGAHVVRAGYAVPTSGKGTPSLVCGPDGSIVAAANSEPTVLRCELDVTARFVKPASHGQPCREHRELLEEHRRPCLYRPYVDRLNVSAARAFPLLCAHRGLSTVCPENTLPAFAATLGVVEADEVELDLWLSQDDVAVVCHDARVDRTTDGGGLVTDMVWDDIMRLDAGIKHGEQWRGVRVPRLEQVLDALDGRLVLNIHVKAPGLDGSLIRLTGDLLRERGMVRQAYIAGDEDVLEAASELAPDVERCSLAHQEDPDLMIDAALRYGCRRVQFGRNMEEQHARRAHEHGLVCNLFWSDDVADAEEYLARGIDVVLTNTAHSMGGLKGIA